MLAPWKTASQTCHASLKRYNESPYDRYFHFNPSLGRVVHQHLTLSDLMALPEGRLGYKKAAFVRNPYDRAYSGFIQIQRDFQIQPKIPIEPNWIRDLIKAQISENISKVIAAGFDFDTWITLLSEYEIYQPGRNTNLPFHPAHYWTHHNNYVVDFIGKVEKFDEEFFRFCELMELDVPKIQKANISEEISPPQSQYSRYAHRMSRRSLDRINELFARDFELFEYQTL